MIKSPSCPRFSQDPLMIYQDVAVCCPLINSQNTISDPRVGQKSVYKVKINVVVNQFTLTVFVTLPSCYFNYPFTNCRYS
jgi:hypothetical protein